MEPGLPSDAHAERTAGEFASFRHSLVQLAIELLRVRRLHDVCDEVWTLLPARLCLVLHRQRIQFQGLLHG